MNLENILINYFDLNNNQINNYLKLNIKKINLFGFTNKFLIFKNKKYSDIQSQNNFDPNLSKIVLFDNEFFYSIYLNNKTNYYLNNLIYLHKNNFYEDISFNYELLYDNNKEIIGFKMKKLNLITKNNLINIKKNTNIQDFYRKIISKQKKYNIIMADICYTNCGYDENNNVYLFDIDSYIDRNLFNNEIEKNDINNIELFWLLDRGYKMFNNLIDIIFDNEEEKKNYYIILENLL